MGLMRPKDEKKRYNYKARKKLQKVKIIERVDNRTR